MDTQKEWLVGQRVSAIVDDELVEGEIVRIHRGNKDGQDVVMLEVEDDEQSGWFIRSDDVMSI